MTEEKTAHPAAEIFPLMEGESFDALVDDIRAHGLRDPITLLDGAILDGRNRYRACRKLGISPRWEQFTGGDPQAFVISHNLHRRHLNESQRAMIGARLAQRARGDQRHVVGIPTSSQAADMMQVDRSQIFAAKRVLRFGDKQQISEVEGGKAAVSTVARKILERSPKRPDPPRKISQTGKNPERIQRRQINAEIWAHVRDALINLTSLPSVTDVVAIARAHDKTGLVDQRVEQSLKWLKEFAHEWRSSDKTKAA